MDGWMNGLGTIIRVIQADGSEVAVKPRKHFVKSLGEKGYRPKLGRDSSSIQCQGHV